MSISTFSELKTAVADFLDRDDLSSSVGNFIALGEANIARDIRHWRMITKTTLTVDAQYEDLPADWLETIRLSFSSSNGRKVELGSLAEIMENRERTDNATGTPQLYAHVGSQLEFWPTPDGSYSAELLYYAKVPALSDAAPTNWLLTYHPDVYLYGALVHTAPYLQEDARVQVWAALYATAAQKLNEESNAARGSGTLRMRTRTQ